jgi:hypothetical protein
MVTLSWLLQRGSRVFLPSNSFCFLADFRASLRGTLEPPVLLSVAEIRVLKSTVDDKTLEYEVRR